MIHTHEKQMHKTCTNMIQLTMLLGMETTWSAQMHKELHSWNILHCWSYCQLAVVFTNKSIRLLKSEIHRNWFQGDVMLFFDALRASKMRPVSCFQCSRALLMVIRTSWIQWWQREDLRVMLGAQKPSHENIQSFSFRYSESKISLHRGKTFCINHER